jgi:hypothetical protein
VFTEAQLCGDAACERIHQVADDFHEGRYVNALEVEPKHETNGEANVWVEWIDGDFARCLVVDLIKQRRKEIPREFAIEEML